MCRETSLGGKQIRMATARRRSYAHRRGQSLPSSTNFGSRCGGVGLADTRARIEEDSKKCSALGHAHGHRMVGWSRRAGFSYHRGAARDGGIAVFADVVELIDAMKLFSCHRRAVAEIAPATVAWRQPETRGLQACAHGRAAHQSHWYRAMKIAAGIITTRAAAPAMAAIVARATGIRGGGHGHRERKSGTNVMISCAEGDIGKDQDAAFDATRRRRRPRGGWRTAIMVTLKRRSGWRCSS